ncbi:probable serine/threonine-protein kinase PBL7 [Prosopis cineraria]|uniref:probable serine/threonine-protein kinase PBL7 n=1 Tax=Prosopis cineraria TaxID=364024 RepID=UPI00240FBC31|nr:probable serine/threonine-protein kinase PBL7 [Prosopis cineraria]
MAGEPQRVVVIMDASKDVSAKVIMKALKRTCPQAGGELTLIAVLEQFSSPLGYKIRVHDSPFIATNQKIVQEELSKKREDYNNSSEIEKLSDYCEIAKMKFHIDVVASPFIEVATGAVISLEATWLIVDRDVNKDRKKLDRLPCGMLRIRSDNTIDKLWDPDVTDYSKSHSSSQAMKIIPGNPDEEISPKRHRTSPSEQFISTGTSSSSILQEIKDKDQGIEQETAKTISISDHHEQRRRDNSEESRIETEFTNPLCSVCKNKRPKVGWIKDLSYTELWKATQGFSQKNFLSEGGFGSVYKAELNGITVAVKKLKNASVQGEKEFKSEVKLLGRARNENVVTLLGFCSEGKHRLLVYEYICNGSLDQHLSQHSRIPLTWEERIKVAIGVSKGLQYLHENNIIHRDVRPNNILITHDRQALLGDFGLARNQHGDSIQSTEVIGTLGYLAPEYAEYGKVSAKVDVYSFGVVLLELITGMRTTDKRLKGKSLVGWARPLLKDRKYHDLIDERIVNSHDFHQLFWMVRIAEKCLTRDPQKRLNMFAVVNALSRILEGNTCIIPRDYSPTRSESSYSSSNSDESEDEDQEGFGSESGLESQSTNSSWSMSLDMMSQSIGRLPPSPPIVRTC